MSANSAVAGKAAAFSREIMRLIPSLMKQYGLHELTTRHQLLRNVHALFRKHADVKDSSDGRPEPIGEHKIRISRYCRAVDTLIFKGRVELEELVKNFKQRHHVLTDYVYGPAKAASEQAARQLTPNSQFLENFYRGTKSSI